MEVVTVQSALNHTVPNIYSLQHFITSCFSMRFPWCNWIHCHWLLQNQPAPPLVFFQCWDSSHRWSCCLDPGRAHQWDGPHWAWPHLAAAAREEEEHDHPLIHTQLVSDIPPVFVLFAMSDIAEMFILCFFHCQWVSSPHSEEMPRKLTE